MNSYTPDFNFRNAKSLNEVFELFESEPATWVPFAGGTDLMVVYEAGKLKSKNFININDIQELKGINVTEDEIQIGALTTFTEIRNHSLIQKEFPMLVNAASVTGAIAIQNRGTIGGNIINASPAADTPPALIAYAAQIELGESTGNRILNYDEFHLDYKKMDIEPNEILTKVILKRNNRINTHYYRKVGTRKAQAISKVCLSIAARKTLENKLENVRIGMGSVAPTPLRCQHTETVFEGQILNKSLIIQAMENLEKDICPISDIRSTKEYRIQVSKNLLKDFLLQTLT